MLSIDEAIAHARAVANTQRGKSGICLQNGLECEHFSDCLKCAEEHEQLAEWLEELKDYRDKNKMVVRVDVENMDSIKDKIEELSKYAERQYNKAIDDFVKKICEKYTEEESKGNYKQYCVEIKQNIADIAEQLKE